MGAPANVLVAGSAHLDVLGQSTGDEATIDRVGRVSIEIGGTACNIATNMANLGLRPRLMTAMQPHSPYTSIIKTHLESHGVEVRAVHHEDLPAAIFSAHIGKDGEMLSAVSCMPLDRAEFDDQQVVEAMNGIRCVVLDCNLSRQSLEQFARIARRLSIPVYAAAVSEDKSLRLGGLATPFDGIFMNRREAMYFGRRVVASTAPSMIAERLGCPLVMSKGIEGATVVDQDQETHVPLGFAPAPGQTLGAGDAMLAAAVKHHVFEGLSLVDAVRQSFVFAGGVIGRENCNTGPLKAVEAALNVLGDQARTDPLTGLGNRRAAEQVMEQAASADLLFSVLMVDIDRFKMVNDTYGHDIGDGAIRCVAGVLRAAVRESDLPCRWGGEEFLCVLPGLDRDMALGVAERIRSEVQAASIPGVGSITVSIGVGVHAGLGDVKDALRRADAALYQAKNSGRNRVEG